MGMWSIYLNRLNKKIYITIIMVKVILIFVLISGVRLLKLKNGRLDQIKVKQISLEVS